MFDELQLTPEGSLLPWGAGEYAARWTRVTGAEVRGGPGDPIGH